MPWGKVIKWSAAEDKAVMDLKRRHLRSDVIAANLAALEIGPKRTKNAVATRITTLTAGTTYISLKARRAKMPRRPCMCCRRAFPSSGPGNRLCNACNLRSSDLSPFAPDGYGVSF